MGAAVVELGAGVAVRVGGLGDDDGEGAEGGAAVDAGLGGAVGAVAERAQEQRPPLPVYEVAGAGVVGFDLGVRWVEAVGLGVSGWLGRWEVVFWWDEGLRGLMGLG